MKVNIIISWTKHRARSMSSHENNKERCHCHHLNITKSTLTDITWTEQRTTSLTSSEHNKKQLHWHQLNTTNSTLTDINFKHGQNKEQPHCHHLNKTKINLTGITRTKKSNVTTIISTKTKSSAITVTLTQQRTMSLPSSFSDYLNLVYSVLHYENAQGVPHRVRVLIYNRLVEQ